MKFSLRPCLAGLLFCLLWLVVQPIRAAGKTEISVHVTNEFQKPVANAVVILDFLGDRQITKLGFKKPIHWEVHTNQEGKAHFPPVPEGKVQLQIVTKKYQTYGARMDVEGDGKLVEVTLHPPQEQYSSHAPLKPKTDDGAKEEPK